MRQKHKKSSPKPPPSQARTAPDEGLETFLKEIGVDDKDDRKPAAADSRRVSESGEGKDDDEDSLFADVAEEKMETNEKGGDEEKPGKAEEESDEESARKPVGKPTGKTGSDEDSDDEMSWADEVEVAPCMPSPEKADLVRVFTGVLGFSVETVKLLVIEQDLRSLSNYWAFPADMFPSTLSEKAKLTMSNLKKLRVFCEWLDRHPLEVQAADFTTEVLDSEIAITASKKDCSPKDWKAMALMPDKF